MNYWTDNDFPQYKSDIDVYCADKKPFLSKDSLSVLLTPVQNRAMLLKENGLYIIITLSIFMKPIRIHQEDVERILKERGPITTKEITRELQCSRSALYAKLKGIPQNTSCNKNGKYHVLQTMVQYDQNGLWYSGEVVFSKWGTLEDTIQHLLDSSEAGLSSLDLGSILNTKIVPQLVALQKVQRIFKVRYGRHHVYYSSIPTIQKSQMEKRSDLVGSPKKVIRTMSKDKIIRTLTVIIKYHAVSFDETLAILSANGANVTDKELTWLFTKYGLKKKSSTP